MKLSSAFMMQAQSDFISADAQFDVEAPSTYCQVASKCQQAVEKSVKAILHRLIEANVVTLGEVKRHDVGPYVTVITHLPKASQARRTLAGELEKAFAGRRGTTIHELDAIVPAWPAAGALAARNHEYPYELTLGHWTMPCAIASFSRAELTRWLADTRKLVDALSRILSALNLLYP